MRKLTSVFITAVFIFTLLPSSVSTEGGGFLTVSPALAQGITSGYSYGVDIDWFICFGQKTSALPPTGDLIQDLGAKSVRFNVIWGYVEPSEGQYDWTTRVGVRSCNAT